MTWICAAAVALLLSGVAHAADLPEQIADETAAPAVPVDRPSSRAVATYSACEEAIAEWAEPYDPVSIETTSAGPVRGIFTGKKSLPLFVRIVYESDLGLETRKANVHCTVHRTGKVDVLLSP